MSDIAEIGVVFNVVCAAQLAVRKASAAAMICRKCTIPIVRASASAPSHARSLRGHLACSNASIIGAVRSALFT